MTIAIDAGRIKQSALGLLITLSLLITSGCGQKGALYLPEDTRSTAAQAPSVDTTQPAHSEPSTSNASSPANQTRQDIEAKQTK